MLAALFLFLNRRVPAPVDETSPRRGGQVVVAVHATPETFNPLIGDRTIADLVAALTQAPLLRRDRSGGLEAVLAESWASSADGRVHTVRLRAGLEWSDGTPITAEDVVFTVQAAFADGAHPEVAARLRVGGAPIRAAPQDARTVVITFASPFGPGLRLLEALPILPRHALQASVAAGVFASAWDRGAPVAHVIGAGPFVPVAHEPGVQVTFAQNPRYWRRAPDRGPLPYLDRIVLRVMPPDEPLLALLAAGAVDLPSRFVTADEYARLAAAPDDGRIRIVELGVSPAPDALWFCLKPAAKSPDPRLPFIERAEFRQAISHAVDREVFAQEVFGGQAVPIWGPITPGHEEWFWPDVIRYQPSRARAGELLASIGLADRNGNGVVEDSKGTEARLNVLLERGDAAHRAASALQASLGAVGIAIDLSPLDEEALSARMADCDYDAMYRPSPLDARDPATDLAFWLSSGSRHVWNPAQRLPATEWERRVDTLMLEQTATLDMERRRQQFILVQRIFAENLPALYFAAPRLHYAHGARVRGIVPSVWPPYVLSNADSLSVVP